MSKKVTMSQGEATPEERSEMAQHLCDVLGDMNFDVRESITILMAAIVNVWMVASLPVELFDVMMGSLRKQISKDKQGPAKKETVS